MGYERDKALSLYNKELHRIMVIDVDKEKKRYYRREEKYYWSNERYFEWYDINKDKWILVEDHNAIMGELSNIYVSDVDPNVMIFIGRKDDSIMVTQFDMRQKKGVVVSKLDMALPSNYLRYDLCGLYL